jgi:hypothetical protein
MVMTKSNTDQIYFTATAIVLLIIALIFVVNKASNKVDQLQHELDINNTLIDSLKHEIDTLMWEQEILDHNIVNNTTHLLSAIMFVESNSNDSAYHKGEDAVGCLQIRKCMVDDVNRILRKQKSFLNFTYDDRWSRTKSIKMFNIYCQHYKLSTAEEIARCWNGGPRGMQNEMTVGYWKKVSNKLDI